MEVPCEETPTYHTDPHPDVGRRSSGTYRRHVTVYEDVDTNDCSDGTVAGALLGGGLAGFGSRGKKPWKFLAKLLPLIILILIQM